MVIDIEEYRHLRGGTVDFKELLLAAPDLEELEIDRAAAPARTVDLGPRAALPRAVHITYR